MQDLVKQLAQVNKPILESVMFFLLLTEKLPQLTLVTPSTIMDEMFTFMVERKLAMSVLKA